MLNELFNIHSRIAALTPRGFKRSLFNRINWDNRMIIITGSRGTGKTTLVLQHYLEKYDDVRKCLYLSADNPLVLKNGIYETAQEYFKYYGECLIIDEVHKEENWSVAVKALYDAYPDRKFILLGSSTLNIMFEKGDLSRRALPYTLPPLSFREYLAIKHNMALCAYTWEEIIEDHIVLATDLSGRFHSLLREFNDFLIAGSYPFCFDVNENEYLDLLSNVLDKIIYEDIPTIKSLKAFSSLKLKKLLAYIATSNIPLFNIESLKNEIGVSKDTLYDYFDLLARAAIVAIIRTESKNVRVMKNSKVLFHSPNIYYAIAGGLWHNDPDPGNIRESFFASQAGPELPVFSSLHLDFLLKDQSNSYEIEVGGKNKKKKQLRDLEKAYVFKDGIEVGSANTIPLYLAGFLY